VPIFAGARALTQRRATAPALPILAIVEQRATGRRLAMSTAIFSLATGISRILGLVREMIAAYYFGAAGKINAFTVAFLLPNLVRALVADAALGAAFVPVFSDLLEKGERKRAWRVASSVFWLMLLGLGGLTALFILAAPLVMRPFHPVDFDLAVGLSRVLFPIVALLGVSGIVVGILNSYGEFSVPALTPVFWNLAIIVGLALGVPNVHTADAKLYVYALSILAGTLLQVLLPIPWLRGRDDRLRLVIDWRDPAVAQTFRLMIPVTLGLGLINVNAVVDIFFASRFLDANIAPKAIDYAFRVYMLPQGLFAVAVTTVLFPSLARLSSRGDLDGFRHTIGLGLRQIAFLLVPAAVASAALATPMVRLLYQRGKFEPSQTAVVAGALAAFSLGLMFNGSMLLLNRAFFSLQSNWVPTTVALANLVLNAVLDAVFWHLGVWGIPLATSFVNMAGTAALLILLRRRIGPIELGQTARAVGLIGVASLMLVIVAWPVWRLLDEALGRSTLAQIASLGTALLAGGIAYLFSCKALHVRELETLLALRARARRV
jgi:putative peptidoglycan lipid II flippase